MLKSVESQKMPSSIGKSALVRRPDAKVVEKDPFNSAESNVTRLHQPCKKLLIRFVNQMVASSFETTAERLLRCDRGNARIARARHVSIYLMHTFLSVPITEIANIYGKDRTTVAHACRVIEDLRDTPAFDDRIIELESTISTVLELAQANPLLGGSDEKG